MIVIDPVKRADSAIVNEKAK